MNWLIWTPFIVLGTLLLLFGLAVLLGGLPAAPIASDRVVPLEGAVPQAVVRADVERCLERENPELASAIRKLQRFGTPTTPRNAARLARLTPGERRAYMEAAGQQAEVPSAEPRGPSSGDRSTSCPPREVHAHGKSPKR